MNPYQFILPRLNGNEVEENFDYYAGLVEKGVAGFIVFGGEVETLRKYIKRLQKLSETPLIIASDLERGLGQQVRGGTEFAPQMALANLTNKKNGMRLLGTVFKAIALEAGYAGINTIFAPVLDINTNPENPIISVRSFGEDPKTVSALGCEMIKAYRKYGINACGKHFPGHGDTAVDSHIGLPVIRKDLQSLNKCELVPFKKAIRSGVRMLMLGHLSVPALEPSGMPVSLSRKTVAFLRKSLGFRGIIITDALNMGGLGGYGEKKAALGSLKAGVDLLLHPSEPERLASYLKKYPLAENKRLIRFRKKYCRLHPLRFSFNSHKKLSVETTEKAVTVEGKLPEIKDPLFIIVDDDKEEKGRFLSGLLKSKHVKYINLNKPVWNFDKKDLKNEMILAVFSSIRAWKGGPSPALKGIIESFGKRASLLISFGSPYIFNKLSEKPKIFAYWDSESSQKAVSKIILNLPKM